MPLSPTDFYAYSQATGAPVADTPEKRARQAPAVLEFRRQQLQPAREESNIFDTLAKTALAAGTVAGGIGAYRALRSPKARTTIANAISPTEVASVRRVATNTPAPSKVVSSPAAVQPATVDLSKVQVTSVESEPATSLVNVQQQQNIAHTEQMQDAVNPGDNQVTNRVVQQLRQDPENDLSKTGFTDFSKKISAQEKAQANLRSVARNIFGQEAQLEQSAKELYDASDLLAPVTGKSLYVERAVENSPNLLSAYLNQDKVTPGLARRREPILNYQYDWELRNIPEFERTARTNAYAQTGEPSYLDAGTYNKQTMGDLAFSRMLGVADPSFNESGHMQAGRLIQGEGEINLGGGRALTNKEGERNPDAEDYMYRAEANIGLVPGTGSEYDLRGAAGVRTASTQEKTEAIKTFRGNWDQMVREGVVIQPRYAQVIINKEQLDMPMDFYQTATNQPFTAVPGGQTLRNRLLQAQVEAIETGGSAMIEMPYQTRKDMARANIHLAQDPQTLNQARSAYHSFKTTGEVLGPLWKSNVAPLLNNEPMEGRGISSKMLYGNLADIEQELEGQGTQTINDLLVKGAIEPNITQGYRGRMTASDIPLASKVTPVYDLKYDHLSFKTKDNKPNPYPSIMTPTVDPKTGYDYLSPVYRAEHVDQLPNIGLTSQTDEQDHVLTQPFGVSRVVTETLPPTTSEGRQEARGKSEPRNFVLKETVRGPLQVAPSKAMGGKLPDLRPVQAGEVPKQKMQELLSQAEQNVRNNPELEGSTAEIGNEAARLAARHPNEGGLGLYIPALVDANAQYEFMSDIKGFNQEQTAYGGELNYEDRLTGKAIPVKGTQAKRPGFGTRYSGLSSTEPYVKMSPNKYGGPDEEFDYDAARGVTTSNLTVARQSAADIAARTGQNITEALRAVGTTRPSDVPRRMKPSRPTAQQFIETWRNPQY